MEEYNNITRAALARNRVEERNVKIRHLPKEEQTLIEDLMTNGVYSTAVSKAVKEFKERKNTTPSEWLREKEFVKVLLPEKYQESFFYIIDKLNQFPFSSGWERRTIRSADYDFCIWDVFTIFKAYDNFAWSKASVEEYLYRQLHEETADYIKHIWDFEFDFNYIYAAEIDKGNQKVIDAFKELILSENNSAYLNREMILGIIRSDNAELHNLLGDFLLAARLQEGIRQSICEAMDEGTAQAFLILLDVIEKNNLIRYSAVERAVATWIGIFDENSTERISNKLLSLMGKCLRDKAFCEEQLQGNDAVAISVALWALGFTEVNDAIKAMTELAVHGTKQQKLTASYYNQSLYFEKLQYRVARKVILENADDLELVAAFFPALSSNVSSRINGLLKRDGAGQFTGEPPKKAILTDYYESSAEAENLYDTLYDVYQRMPRKGLTYFPCIFPWHQVELSRSELIRQLAFLAYVLEDEEKMTQVSGFLEDMTGTYGRHSLINLLLCPPKNKAQREILIKSMGIAEEYSSRTAISIVKNMTLTREDYQLMEDMLRFKRGGLRRELLDLLDRQTENDMEDCLKRLLSDKKEEKRTGGLDLLLRLSKQEEKAAFFERVKPLAALVEQPSDKENVLLAEILGEHPTLTAEKGFGFYNPDAKENAVLPKAGTDTLKQCILLPEDTVIKKLQKLDALICEHKNDEFRTIWGETKLIGYAFQQMKEGDSNRLENYPLAKELRDFYEQEIGDYSIFLEMEALTVWDDINLFENIRPFYDAVFGKMPFTVKPFELGYEPQIRAIWRLYHAEFAGKKFLLHMGIESICALLPILTKENRMIPYQRPDWKGDLTTDKISVTKIPFFKSFFDGLAYWQTDEEFLQAFSAAWAFELRCAQDREREQFTDGELRTNRNSLTPLKPYWFMKAYHMGLVSKDIVWKALLQYYPRMMCIKALTQLVKEDYTNSKNYSLWRDFFGNDLSKQVIENGAAFVGPNTWCGKLARELYNEIVPVFMDIELRRGEAETIVTQDMRGVTYVQGIDYLIRILKALGKDTLSRDTYYSWYSWHYNRAMDTKKEILCFLLKACYPKEDDSAKQLKAALKGTGITQQRLVEVAMYAPQWIDIIESYLAWSGLKSGCYYFMAHMNERFDDRKTAIIAKYTPLSTQELQGGAFDIDWFQECYRLLGEKNFGILYNAAKYISDGQKHSRARKYADAATGKVTLEHLREEISTKRNKDLLMSYSLVPFAKNRQKDLLARYQFIQQFAKEAKQFGAQRRASEIAAAQTALVNLSVHAGFTDVTRLILNMETELIQEFVPYLRWTAVEDVEICININELGKSEILCRKKEKPLKSLPSRLKKNTYVLAVKEAHKTLKEQYVRTKKLMEEAMENGDLFTTAETAGLFRNPVVKAILAPLVFVCGKYSGFVQTDLDGGGKCCLVDCKGQICFLQDEDMLRIAHPLDLYQTGIWHDYQKDLFDRQIRQPFKQVFRELYVKMDEELGLTYSKMFAGNQIQPMKTVGCLKGRRWVADFEEGLQKIYYKENIIAKIYALADWFSPSDIEAPTLEMVVFSDRKTFAPIAIKDVPDLIYSEVMRDVDLAVSVAHAGGVDPETSHSTIEMRRAIVAFNLPLFGLENVTLKGNHALIAGKRGNYSVHLGSGVVHLQGGAMLHILPVHSQKRGRLFLPFVDEDPKTAEIMSKIVLLAEDGKIKDPSILGQL